MESTENMESIESTEKKKKTLRTAAFVGVAVLIMLAGIALGYFIKSRTDADKLGKVVTVEIMTDEYAYSVVFNTGYGNLGDLLDDEGLIAYNSTQYGRIITAVNGIFEEENKRWNIAADGEPQTEKVDLIDLKDGVTYSLTLDEIAQETESKA